MNNVIKVASTRRSDVRTKISEEVLKLARVVRDDFTHEFHVFSGSFLLEMTFPDDATKVAKMIKLVFGHLEVELR